MRRRRLVLATVLVVVLGSAGALLVRGRSLATGALRAAAEARLSAALGQPVTIETIGFSLTPRPAFTGAGIRVGEADSQAPGVRIDRLRLTPQLRSFFSDSVRIEEVLLDGFTVSILRDRNGRWHVPAAVPVASHDARGAVVIDRVRIGGGRLSVWHEGDAGATETSSVDDIRADMLIEPGGLRLAPLAGRVGGAAIDGEARTGARSVRLTFHAAAIGDADLAPLVGLLGSARPATLRLDEPAAASVTVTIDRASSRLTGTGTLRMPALTVDPLRLQRLEAPFTVDGAHLAFAPTTFVLNGGSHSGRVALSLDRDPPRWSADSRVERIDIGSLLDTLAARDVGIEGTGRVDARLQGRIERDFVAGSEGRARIELGDGVLRGFPLLSTVNRALRLAASDDNDTRFERLSATLAMARRVATTDDLTIEAGHLRAELSGRIGFDRAIDLRGRAIVSPERAAAAVASVRELARARNSRGEIVLPLTIAGTLDAPRFRIDVETAIREGVRDELLRRLRRLIRR